MKIKNKANLIPYSPLHELTETDLIAKAILECLINNDPEGVMEVVEIYLGALQKKKFIQESHVKKRFNCTHLSTTRSC